MNTTPGKPIPYTQAMQDEADRKWEAQTAERKRAEAEIEAIRQVEVAR